MSKKVVKYTPTLPQESLLRIKLLLEKINEDMRKEVYGKPACSTPTLRVIRGGKS